MTPYLHVTVLICIVASLKGVPDILNNPKRLQTARYLRAGIEKPDFEITNEPNENKEADTFETVKKRYDKQDAIADITNYLQASKQHNMFTPIPQKSRRENHILSLRMTPKRAKIVRQIRKHNEDMLYSDAIKNFDDLRRKGDDDDDDKSSSREMMPWKEEWKKKWLIKQWEAINSTLSPQDTVQMIAARGWGTPCGDPAQHDIPWGTCMLTQECEPEFRIYRGDYFCGRSMLICCAIQNTVYDVYQGFEATFEDKGLSTDSEELKNGKKCCPKKKKDEARRKRAQDRQRRKDAIRKYIRKIVREISSLLNRARKNATKDRQRQTKRMKAFVKHLKAQFKEERKTIKRLHAEVMLKIDSDLLVRLEQLRLVNVNFWNNATFREIVTSGFITKTGARMLLEAYPELGDVLHVRRMAGQKDYVDYDVQYGLPSD